MKMYCHLVAEAQRLPCYIKTSNKIHDGLKQKHFMQDTISTAYCTSQTLFYSGQSNNVWVAGLLHENNNIITQ